VRAAEQQVQALEATVAQRDARIKSLEAVRLTKDQVEKLKEMKLNAKRHEAENRTLTARLTDMRQQLAAATAAANKHRSSNSSSVKEELNSSSSSSGVAKPEAASASASDNSAAAAAVAEQAERLAQLEEVKDMLSDKLRKYVAHCKKLEGERGSIKAALEHAGVDCSHYDNLADGVSALADPQTTGSFIGSTTATSNSNTSSSAQQQLAAAEQRVAQLETRLRDGMASYAELERAEAAARAAHEAVQQQLAAERTAAAAASGELRALREGARDAEERSRQLTFLEAENLQLMLEIKDVRKQCVALKAEVDALRTAAAAAAAVESPTAATSAGSSGKALAALPVNSAVVSEQSADAPLVSKATATGGVTGDATSGNVSGVFDKENNTSATAAVSKRGKARALIEQPVEDCPEGECKQS
jgi:myosin heavy subunit